MEILSPGREDFLESCRRPPHRDSWSFWYRHIKKESKFKLKIHRNSSNDGRSTNTCWELSSFTLNLSNVTEDRYEVEDGVVTKNGESVCTVCDSGLLDCWWPESFSRRLEIGKRKQRARDDVRGKDGRF